MLPYTATQQGVQEIKGRKVGLRGGSGPAHLGNDWSWGPCHTEPGWLIKTEKLVNSACLDHEVTKEKSVSRPSKKKKDYLVQEVQEKHKRMEEHTLPMQRSKADDATSG